jgi:hypothetical protein
MVFNVFTFRVYLTFEKAVTLILKHATFLRQFSYLPKVTLIFADLDYQMANIDVAIQQHLMPVASASDISVEQFAGFIMNTDIGLFILSSVTSISYQPFSSSTMGLKHFLKPNLMKYLFILTDCHVLSLKWLTHW